MVTWAQPSSVVRVTAASMRRSRVVSAAVVTVMNGTCLSRRGSSRNRLPLQRDEVELLADAAVGAAPALGDVRPVRPGREPLALVAGDHVVGVAAAGALGGEHLDLLRRRGGEPVDRDRLLVRGTR